MRKLASIVGCIFLWRVNVQLEQAVLYTSISRFIDWRSDVKSRLMVTGTGRRRQTPRRSINCLKVAEREHGSDLFNMCSKFTMHAWRLSEFVPQNRLWNLLQSVLLQRVVAKRLPPFVWQRLQRPQRTASICFLFACGFQLSNPIDFHHKNVTLSLESDIQWCIYTSA